MQFKEQKNQQIIMCGRAFDWIMIHIESSFKLHQESKVYQFPLRLQKDKEKTMFQDLRKEKKKAKLMS